MNFWNRAWERGDGFPIPEIPARLLETGRLIADAAFVDTEQRHVLFHFEHALPRSVASFVPLAQAGPYNWDVVYEKRGEGNEWVFIEEGAASLSTHWSPMAAAVFGWSSVVTLAMRYLSRWFSAAHAYVQLGHCSLDASRYFPLDRDTFPWAREFSTAYWGMVLPPREVSRAAVLDSAVPSLNADWRMYALRENADPAHAAAYFALPLALRQRTYFIRSPEQRGIIAASIMAADTDVMWEVLRRMFAGASPAAAPAAATPATVSREVAGGWPLPAAEAYQDVAWARIGF